MNSGRTVFSQIMDHLPKHRLHALIEQYRGNYKVSRFSCLDQFYCMAFAQLTYRESLRDIEACLRAQPTKHYHLGIRHRLSRSTLADANEHRDWRIFAGLAQVLIGTAQTLHAKDDLGIGVEEAVYAFDSTTIDLCLALFPWARFRKRKAAIKLHTLLDLRGSIPSCILITEGKVHDVNALDLLVLEPGAYYLVDRGYLDFARLNTITRNCAFFVTRPKRNTKYRILKSHPVAQTARAAGVLTDHTIRLTGVDADETYPQPLRRIKYRDPETSKLYRFLTNSFDLDALTIAQLYKARWKVELFFKWIKQHLRIKAFFGTSANAVKTQVWIAVTAYLLVVILRKRLGLSIDLYRILQILSVHLFEKVDIRQLLTETEEQNLEPESRNDLTLFDL